MVLGYISFMKMEVFFTQKQKNSNRHSRWPPSCLLTERGLYHSCMGVQVMQLSCHGQQRAPCCRWLVLEWMDGALCLSRPAYYFISCPSSSYPFARFTRNDCPLLVYCVIKRGPYHYAKGAIILLILSPL